MKTLNLHCDYVKFKALKKALKTVDEIAPEQTMEGESKDCLVVMTAIEKGDSKESVPELVKSIKKIAADVKTENIVLYPYAHLSSNLGKPSLAVEILNETAKQLQSPSASVSGLPAKRSTSEAVYQRSGLNVVQAPFGYYKTFELKVKGHPLSELSREIIIKGDEETEEELTDLQRKNLLKQISKATLDTSKLKDNDHRIIGRKMDLWSFNSVAPGMPFYHPKGLHIKNKLIEYWREVHRKAGYSEISTPQILDKKLWEISGHWGLYKDNMFTSNYENREFAVKPMNCPGAMIVYKTSPKSYKDLPMRVGELGLVHRQELSGVLAGLFRVIQFTQDDAHIYCTKEQLHSEIVGVLNLFREMLEQFGFKDYRFTISTRSEKKASKYLGKDEDWKIAEEALVGGLKKLKLEYTTEPGEAKFYGPSLDIQIKDSLEREWQCSTLQLDFALPKRFDITYLDNQSKEQTPFMLHRVVFGSIERFMGVLTEHLSGKFPLWISPNQIKILTLNDETKEYAQQIYNDLFDSGFQVELNDKSESMGKKAREAQIQRFNYLLTVGEKEKSENKIAVRSRDSKEITTTTLEEFKEKLKTEISSKTL